MPSQSAISPLLSNHLSSLPPAGSLTLITSVLGASTNWIILQLIQAALKAQPLGSSEQGENVKVILISWLRGSDFWREGAKRLGLNLEKDERIACFDALQSGLGLQGGVAEVEEVLSASIDGSKPTGTKVLLVLDGIDFLLAATETTVDDVLGSIGELREHVHATIVSLSADYPLIQTQQTPLELNHAALVTTLAHQARVIWGARELDTGSARDVSGVLRITRGPTVEADKDTGEEDVEEKELLYFVAGDGGVKLFERGFL